MMLSDFSPMIELAVTLNIAFVAVEYVKSYTNAVCNQLFNFAEYLKQSFDECKSLLVDEITLHSIPNTEINGKSIVGQVEQAKISREKITSDINNELTNFQIKIENVCQSKSISAVSFWMFFYGLSCLFCMGIISISKEEQLELFILWQTFFTIIYSIVGWLIGEKGYKNCCFNFTSLRHALVSYIIGLVLSLFFTYFGYLHEMCIKIFPVICIFSVLYMYSNFVVSSCIIWFRASKVKKEIKTNVDEYKVKCNNLKDDVNKLLTVHEVELKMEKDNKPITINNNDSSQLKHERPRKKTKRERMLDRNKLNCYNNLSQKTNNVSNIRK